MPQLIKEAKRLQELAGIRTELFGLGNDKKYHLVVTVPQDVPRANIKAGKYKIDLPKRMWPGVFNNDSKELYSYLGKYPSSTKVELVNDEGEVEETGIMNWFQNTPKGEINLDENQINEDKNLINDPKILALAAKIVKQPVDKVEDKVEATLTGKEEENKENVNESLAITLALALPMILEAGGSIAGWINKKYGLSKEELEEYKKWQVEYSKLKEKIDSYTDTLKSTDPKTKRYVENKKAELAKMKEEGNKKFGGKIAKFLKESGHGLHSLYTSPIRALLWTISLFTPKGSDLRDAKVREKLANIIYATGMIVFAGVGVYQSLTHLAGVSEAATAIIDGAKTGKSVSEIIQDIPTVVKAFAT